jgi:hypothetical protein
VYVLKCRFNPEPVIKIGFTARNDLWLRLDEVGRRLDFEFLRAIRSDDALGLELHLKRRFKAKRIDAWQSGELFRLDVSDLLYIESLEELEGHKCHHRLTVYDPSHSQSQEAA